MKYLSTSGDKTLYSSRDAILTGLAPDGGLFVPQHIPPISSTILDSLVDIDPTELLVELIHPFIDDALSKDEVEECIKSSINFPTPLVSLDESLAVLELFHGPTCAFKDYGARFMAQLFSRLHSGKQPLTVLVATSGDTGGAVASGFHQVEGIRVVILYPSKKISSLQELQLTTWGDNIFALEVEGDFDDCQQLVKQAFIDSQLKSSLQLTSANSINISRLLPQSSYYALGLQAALKQDQKRPVQFIVPSGNLGNLSAGLLAHKRGLPIERFFCALNANNSVANYLNGDGFNPRPAIQTISNAMDVGNPSNFSRM
ncbi:UNVERIFIED_CONTAM: hypothetical protein GTU68_008254, partial [Idotea baltica]|nr:hypothetical protein [Idotea baltica]